MLRAHPRTPGRPSSRSTLRASHEGTRFKEDLEADSLDLVELVVELEDSYGDPHPRRGGGQDPHGRSGRGLRRRPCSSDDALRALRALASCSTQLPEDLRRQAFTHASWVEHRAESYERLAFLGDVVLSLAVSTHLFPRFERYGAGRLTKVRAQAVSGALVRRVARELGVPDALARPRRRATGRSVDDAGGVGARARLGLRGRDRRRLPRASASSGTAAAVVEAVRRARSTRRSSTRWTTSRCCRSGSRAAARSSTTGSTPRTARRTTAASWPWPRSPGEELGRGEGKTKKGAEQEAAAAGTRHLDGGRR